MSAVPPPAPFGIQLQRVRVTSVSLWQNEPQAFDIFSRDVFGDRVANHDPAKGRQTQLVLDLDLSVTTTDAIAASPGVPTNQVLAFTPRLVCDLTGLVPPGPGIALRVAKRSLEWPPGSLPALPPSPVPLPMHLIQQAIEDEALQHVPDLTRRLDPEGRLHGGQEAVNAGLAGLVVIGFARAAVSFLPPALALPLQFAIGEGVAAGEDLLQGIEVPPQKGITFTRPGPYSVRGVIELPAPAELVGPGASIRRLA